MKKERNLKLRTDLEIKRRAKIIAIIVIVLLDILITCGMLVLCFLPTVVINRLLCVWVVIILLITVIGYKVLYKMIKETEEYSNSRVLAELYLTESRKVIPIKAKKYPKFIFGLRNKAEFYAVLNRKSNKVKITIKFNNEEEITEFEEIDKEFFTEYYKLE